MTKNKDMVLEPAFDGDDLQAVLRRSWGLIELAARDRRQPMHTIQLGTLARDGGPQVRTVVLREASAADLRLRFHTDWRSEKIAELQANPAVLAHLYDPPRKLQLRLQAQATIHHEDDVAQAAWEATGLFSRRCYLCDPGPGAATDRPHAGWPEEIIHQDPSREASEAGFANFCVIRLHVQAVHWLYLTVEGNRAATFRYEDGVLRDSGWVIP